MVAQAFSDEERRHYGQGAAKVARVWRYVLPHNQTSDGGTFLLDSAGMFSGQSAYGGYAYRWGAFGDRDFRDFLASCGPDYLYSKLSGSPRGMRGTFSDDKTRRAIRRAIWETFGQGFYDRDRFEEETELLRNAGDFSEPGVFDQWLRYTKLEEPWFCAGSSVEDPECLGFCTLLMPRLQRRLRFDLSRGLP